MSFRFLLVLLLIVFLGACAMHHPIPSAQNNPVGFLGARQSHPTAIKPDELLYEDLVGEIANQEGQETISVRVFMHLAKVTHDVRFVQHALEIALHDHQITLAEQAAKLWIRLDPKATEPVQMLAVMLIEKGDFNRALPYVESVLNRKDINDNVVFSNLDSLVAQIPDVERALAFALSLAKHYPDKYQAHIFAGETAFRAKKAAVALQQVNVALTLNPHSPEAAVLKGVILDRQSPEAAVNFLKVFLNHDNDPNVRLVYARALVSASHFHAARAQFELLAKSNPDNAAINLAVGLLSAQMGDWKVAHAYFLRALTLPVANKEQIKLYLGQTEQALGHPHKALDWYASVIEGPYYVMARIRLAGVLSDEGKNHDAMAVLSSLPVSNLQDRIVVTLAKTELLNKMGKRRRAYVLLDKLYKEAPANPDVLYAHGLAAERIGLEGVFESDMHQLIALKPDDGQAYNALGYTYADHDVHLKEAGILLDKAYALLPDDPLIMDSLGWLQYRLGHFQQALADLKKAYTAYPDPEIGAHWGEVLWQAGHHYEARKIWDKCLRLHPDNVVLKATIKRLEH